MSGGRIALLVVGIIILLGSLAATGSGCGLMWLGKVLENDNPLFASGETSLRKADARALVSEAFEIGWYDEYQSYNGWTFGDLLTVRIQGEGQDASKGIFMGIAEETEVDRYLSGVQYYEIKQWATDTFDDTAIEYQLHPGSQIPSDPTTETFWEASAHGQGRQTLEWKPKMGRWVLVIMNEDGSAGIDMKGAVGTELPWLHWLGLGLLVAGIASLVGGAIMVFFAARTPKPAATPRPGTP